MKKLLALLLTVLMLISAGAALAEPSTAYYVSVMDPIVYSNGETSLDMTGLNVDLGALVSDVGCFAAQALVNVGENYETSALAAQAQLDSNGLTFSIDGMEKVYSVDLTQFTNGFDVTSFLPQIPAHTLLNTPIEMESISIDLSLPVRHAFVTGMLAEFTAEDGAIAIDKTQGELIVNRVLTALETAGESLNVEGVAELRAQQLAFDLTGNVTVEGDPAANAGSYAIAGTGKLYAAGLEDGIPFELSFTDSVDAMNMTIDMGPEGEKVVLTADSAFTTAADGRFGMDTIATATMNGEEELIAILSALPVEESVQTDYVFSVQVPAEEADVTLMLSTGTNGDDLGFAFDVFATDGVDTFGAYLYYDGEKVVDEYGTALNGFVSVGVDSNSASYGVDTYLLLQAKEAGRADFSVPFDRQGLADYLGVDRSGLSSEMGKLKREGILDFCRSDFRLLRLPESDSE